jgi:serine/threonine protein kinase
MLNHPNIVKLIGTCTEIPHLCIILEYIPMGSLDCVMKDKANQFSWNLCLKFLDDIAKGMAYLHQCNIIHRDMKSLNVLAVSLEESAPIHAKITDFGVSRVMDRTKTGVLRTMTNHVGTVLWNAPVSIGDLL